MAGTNRTTAFGIDQRLKALAQRPYEYGFYAALRLIECLYWEKPRVGLSQAPGDEPIRLAQESALSFAPSSLSDFTPGQNGQPHKLSVRLLGLLGTDGPLPLHYTEYIQRRRREHGDRALAGFLDIFHHRILSLFYRAWANNEPTVNYDRPETDRFKTYVGALAGFGMTALCKRDAIADHTKHYYCGRLASQTKNAEGLQALISDYFDIHCSIEAFIGEWIPLPQHNICRLGLNEATGHLGESVVVGTHVWSCQHKFRIHLGPMSMAEYQRLLPIGDRIRRLVPLVRNYIGDELAWDVHLILNHEDVPMARLDGTSRLGWTTWIRERDPAEDADDLVLDALAWGVRKED